MGVDAAGDPVVAGVSLTGRPTYKTECNFVAAKLARETGVVTWRATFPDCESDETISSSGGEQLLIDPRGDVIVGRRSLAGRLYGVVKLGGATGELVWRREPVGEFPKNGPFAHATALDPAGAIVAGGGFGEYSSGFRTDLVVAKLEGREGGEVWRRSFRGEYPGHLYEEAFNRVAALAVGATGDVFATGVLIRSLERRRWTITRFDGTTGATRWTHVAGVSQMEYTGPLGQDSFALDARDDVVAVALGNSSAPQNYVVTVVKLSGETGAQRWRRRLPGRSGGTLAITPDGDVVAAATLERPRRSSRIAVVRLDGRTGSVRWLRKIRAAAEGRDDDDLFGAFPRKLAVDAAGHVLLAGLVWNPGHGWDLLVVGLDAATGAGRWRQEFDGEAHGDDDVRGLAVSRGDVVVVGDVENVATGVDAVAVALSASSGEVRWRLECDGSDAGCALRSPVR